VRLATWNVNSIRARLPRLLEWLASAQPDVVCLQELKVADQGFPAAAVAQAGYSAVVHGQSTYNGVAILSRAEATDVERGFGDGVDDPQSRLVAATVDGIRVVSAYVPNGAEIGSDKYAYKLAWLGRLDSWLAANAPAGARLVLCGDLNMARDELDVRSVAAWRGTVLFNDELSAWFERLLDHGLHDLVREHHPQGGIYTWWDYRQLGFPRNDGLRIDHVLASRPIADACVAAGVDRDQRKGEKPSDHAPVVVELLDRIDPPR